MTEIIGMNIPRTIRSTATPRKTIRIGSMVAASDANCGVHLVLVEVGDLGEHASSSPDSSPMGIM